MGEKNFYVRDDDEQEVAITIVRDAKKKPASIMFDSGGDCVITVPTDQFEKIMQEYLVAKAGV